MADNDHAPEVVQRLLNLLYLIRVTAKLGEDTLPADFVADLPLQAKALEAS